MTDADPTATPLSAAVVPSPLGDLTVVVGDFGVRAILFPVERAGRVPIADGAIAAVPARRHRPLLDRVARELDEYFGGRRRSFTLPLDPRGTDFQLRAWRALSDIPYGATSTYARQAAAVGAPTAVRAVGAANGRNPISIVVPCHRVVGANGSLTGYAGGVDAKRFLLDLESADGERLF